MITPCDHSWYGWRPQLKDSRDRPVMLGQATVSASVDLRMTGLLPPVMNQGAIGSCTAHGTFVCAGYDLNKKNPGLFKVWSPLGLYWWSRYSEGTVGSDSGAVIRDVMKVIADHGVGSNDYWPYDLTKLYDKPSQDFEDDSPSYKAQSYSSVANNSSAIKAALAQVGPVVFGMTIYSSFESEEVTATGIVPMPGAGENVMGGHCMAFVGYANGRYIVQNSWDTDWGDKGFCYIPEAYINEYASDLWTINMFGSDNEKAAGAL